MDPSTAVLALLVHLSILVQGASTPLSFPLCCGINGHAIAEREIRFVRSMSSCDPLMMGGSAEAAFPVIWPRMSLLSVQHWIFSNPSVSDLPVRE